ncbi:winged helix-turn-helix transcriptional regulator [Nocardia sp. NBC_01388]|uniref:winged helix-turn-helix transcriptional regulator n=1 Tax=Nocardia sp. NBC_01388 TaxID=2903596 RepID=UPI00324CD92B
MEKSRQYGQGCPLASALDVLGERWTLLIIRELLLGPKRFTDLGVKLAAAGPNRLTSRLRRLQAAGVVEKTSSGAYALTEFGEGLRGPVIGFGLWGLGLMQEGIDAETARPDMVALCMTGAVSPNLLSGLTFECEVYTYESPESEGHTHEVFTMSVREFVLSVLSGPSGSESPIELYCSSMTFIGLIMGSLTLADARRTGQAEVRGKGAGLPKLFAAFAATTRELTPAV